MGLRCGILVLLLFPLLSQGNVTPFTNCLQFFVNRVHPTVLRDPMENNRYREICQCLMDQNNQVVYYYATLYDTKNKIPVYSAYTLQHSNVSRKDPWYVEPQLDNGSDLCMGAQQPSSIIWGQHQALNKDYVSSGYHKGHLYPVYHTSTDLFMLATSTLTNAAPQDSHFNQGQWRTHEYNLVIKLLQNADCLMVYVVTGVVPGNIYIGNGVRVAKYYWSANCCVIKYGPNNSQGYLGPDNNGKVETLTVQQLETRLNVYYNSPFSVFRGGC
ncbi:endonuclease domain-containing 1 protein-like [Salvelinus sp. IW2-2015]|uniref:endonuclease domain-containing 1 protein-like n=1 Tax=Salvelinus sp. IW2-2015 TaxID=2691554 RepID=UPI000CDF994C|nr:endonuclease domain-containing 1 protein-like [Salvelinus alpinus]